MKTAFRQRLLRLLPAASVTLLALAVGVGMAFFVIRMQETTPQAKKMVQQISLIQPPMPPPPPLEQPPPEPEMQEEVEAPQPEDMPEDMPELADEGPAGDYLGVDADGGAGGDAFGLIGRKGGRDLLANGGVLGWYSGVLQQDILDFLASQDAIRSAQYTVGVSLWLRKDGKVRKIVLTRSSGDATMDKKIRQALEKITQISEKPPDELPQPVRLQISSKL